MSDSIKCRKCGWVIMSGEWRFGSPISGWEHMEGECLSPAIPEGEEPPPYRELTDAEEQAEEATWD